MFAKEKKMGYFFPADKKRWRVKSAEKGKYETLTISSLDSLNTARYLVLMDSKSENQLFLDISVI